MDTTSHHTHTKVIYVRSADWSPRPTEDDKQESPEQDRFHLIFYVSILLTIPALFVGFGVDVATIFAATFSAAADGVDKIEIWRHNKR